MSDAIGNIFYFGSPKDGFKVYPDPGALSNIFSGYYTNTENDWIFVARKSEEITRYTFVRYGLLTSVVEGRTGSCFGISIDFVNHYFTDLKVFLTEIFEGIWGAILDEKQLLEIQESSGKVAFRSYDLNDVSPYLDGISKRIKEVILNQKYSAYVRPAYEIPQADDNHFYGLHPDSSASALIEYFRTYGAIKVAPNLPIETKSLSEKQQEDRENLKKKIEELTEQLRQKERDLQAVNHKLEKLHGFAKQIVREFPAAAPANEIRSQVVTSRPVNQTYEALSSTNHKTQHTAVHNPHQDAELTPRAKKVLLLVGVAAILLAILATIYLEFDETDQPMKMGQPAQPASQPTAPVALPDPLIIVKQNGRDLRVLNESVFFEHARGVTIVDEAGFKEVLTSFLFRFSPEVREVYKDNKDDLWQQIRESNPISRQKLSTYLNEKRSFKIDGSADQQAILRGLVIYAK